MADLEKLYEELSALTLLEAAELKKMLEDRWGVTAAAPVAVAGMMPGGAGGAEEAEEEKTEFDVVLTDHGPKKIQVIKAVRALTNLGLKEAKAVVEDTPSTILEAVSKEVAEEAKAKLEAEGAVVEIK
jgi:large subunit ribosomal protein L7/L12